MPEKKNQFQNALSKLDAFTSRLGLVLSPDYYENRRKTTIEYANMIITWLRNECLKDINRLAKARGSTLDVGHYLALQWAVPTESTYCSGENKIVHKLSFPCGFIEFHECIPEGVSHGIDRIVISGKSNKFRNLELFIPPGFVGLQDLCSAFDVSEHNDQWTFVYNYSIHERHFDVTLAQAIILANSVAPDYSNVIISYANNILIENHTSFTVQILVRYDDHSKILEELSRHFQPDGEDQFEWQMQNLNGHRVEIATYIFPNGTLHAQLDSSTRKFQSIKFDADANVLDSKKNSPYHSNHQVHFPNVTTMCREFSRNRRPPVTRGSLDTFEHVWCRISKPELVIAETIIMCKAVGGFSSS